ncbi:MAG: 50S ribosomal protein L9 [Verrucomicrobia bacterium]|nr:50S ribosomal protein L9 [Verrucomicrobiota bacterium]
MAKVEVILIENVVGLGGESDQVKVAAGYARNFLLPKRLAIPLSGANKRRLEALRQRRAEREAHEFNAMSELAKSLSKLTAVISVKTGDDGKMFGSVTAGSIADQLRTQFEIALEKKKIHLPEAIRTLGDHDVELRLHPEVRVNLKVKVQSSNPPPAVEASPKGDQEGGDRPRTEKRGPRRSDAPRKTEPKAEKAK